MIEFWKRWKNVTPLEKAGVKSLRRALRIILKSIPHNRIVSVYVGGSFVRREMNVHSDVDVWVITSDVRGQKLVTGMIRGYDRKDVPLIGFSGYALWELKHGRISRQIGKLRTGPMRWVKNLPYYHLIYGKKLRCEDFPVRSDVDDLKHLVNAFYSKFLPLYRVGMIDFQMLLKQVFWLADLELKLKGHHPPHSWTAIVLMTDNKHIARLAFRLRGRRSDKRTKRLFIVRLKKYLSRLEGLC